MTAFNLHFLLWILLQASMFWNISPYRIFYAEEECRKGGAATIYLGNDTDNSSGIFRASRDGRQLPEMHCHIILKPPLYSEIVTSVRGVELTPSDNCHSYLELNSSSDTRIRLCGNFHDKTEMESYVTFGDTDLIFHTEHLNASAPKKTKMQFEIIFTALQSKWTAKDTTTTKCSNEEFRCLNGRCVWKGLLNDGHNNCGDLSDEFILYTSDISQSNQLPAGMTLVVVIPIIILSLALIVLLVCCFGHRLTAKIERLIQTEQRRNEVARNALVNSGSPLPRQNYNTITVESNVITQNTDILAPRLDVEVSGHVYQQWRSRLVGERRVSPDHTDTDFKNEMQLPPYDPPPSYASVTV